MIPSVCPICNSPFQDTYYNYSKACPNRNSLGNSHYNYSPSGEDDYSYFDFNDTCYRLYNNYSTHSSTIRTYNLIIPATKYISWKLVAAFNFNIPIKSNSISRLLNLKAFI